MYTDTLDYVQLSVGSGSIVDLQKFTIFKLFFFFFLTAEPAAYESFWARSGNGAAAAGLCHSYCNCNTGRSRIFDLCHSLWQRWILNPLSEARD